MRCPGLVKAHGLRRSLGLVRISWFCENLWVEEISWSCEISWYKWDPEKDELSPGLGELNLNKKKRGEKKPNLEPVRTKTEQTLVWAGVLGNWPSPTLGGCRFLLQCQEWFLVQK